MKKYNKNKGYLLLEILICMFLFSVLVFVISVFLKRVVLIEKEKKENQLMYENVYFISDKIIEDIKNRDMEAFGYEGNTDNIHIKNEEIIMKKDGKFYKLEYSKGKLYVSDGDDITNLGTKSIIGQYDNVEFKRIDDLLVINLKYKKNNEVRGLINGGNQGEYEKRGKSYLCFDCIVNAFGIFIGVYIFCKRKSRYCFVKKQKRKFGFRKLSYK